MTTGRVLFQTEGVMRSADMDSCLLTWSNWLTQMQEILCCDWLPERTTCRPGLPADSRKKVLNSSLCHIMNPLLNKFAQSRRLDIVLVLFSCVSMDRYEGPLLSYCVPARKDRRKGVWLISILLDLTDCGIVHTLGP